MENGMSIIDFCLNCNIELVRDRPGTVRKFCSNKNKCQSEFYRKNAIASGIAGAGSTKRHLVETRGYKCEECEIDSWNGKSIVLELDHINGDSNDNSLENVRLLCPNCHSQTHTFRIKNRGSGRKKIGVQPKPFYPKFLDPVHQ